MELATILTAFTGGGLFILTIMLVIQKVEHYQDRQDYLESRAALYEKARRDGRI
jgi:hypothetical protein